MNSLISLSLEEFQIESIVVLLLWSNSSTSLFSLNPASNNSLQIRLLKKLCYSKFYRQRLEIFSCDFHDLNKIGISNLELLVRYIG